MRVVQQTLINSPYLSPALSFWQVEKDGQYLGRLGSSRGYRSSRAARAGHSCPLCQQPPPSCSAEDRHFQGAFHSARLSPKDVPPTHTANTHLAWPRRTSTSLAEHPGENSGPVWKQQQIASVLGERPSVKVCVHGVFRRRVPLLTLASALAMQRQNSSWDFLVGSKILLQANTQLKHHPEIFAGKLLL